MSEDQVQFVNGNDEFWYLDITGEEGGRVVLWTDEARDLALSILEAIGYPMVG